VDQQTLIALCAAGMIACLGFLFLSGNSSGDGKRLRQFQGKKSLGSNIREKLSVEDSGARRKQIEESLGKIEERQNAKKKKAKSIQSKLIQADWKMKPQNFIVLSIVLALVGGAIAFFIKPNPLIVLGVAIVLGFGLPRFILNFAINKRQAKFTAHFADAMDIIVRGVRTGLPLNDCLKIIAHESPDPLGSEFRLVVEGEQLGIPIEVCLEQLYERMPISEVNFFATVLNIQKSTGGNLGESLANLSNVLRGRKMLREKIKALSAEAKVSAIIIGALPIVVMILATLMSPDYMMPLYNTPTGQRNLMFGAGMMFCGTMMMRKMINFKF